MDINDLDIDQVCRVCLKNDLETVHLFDESQSINGIFIAAMIEECTIYKVERHNDLPHLICKDCAEDVKTAYDFKKRYEASHRTLIAYMAKLKATEFPCFKKPIKREEKLAIIDNYSCEQCNEICGTAMALKEHKNLKHKIPPLECLICKETFERPSHLNAHLHDYHPGVSKKIQNMCKVCMKQFTRREHLNRHLRNVHKVQYKSDTGTFTCGLCSQVLSPVDLKCKDLMCKINAIVDNKYCSPKHKKKSGGAPILEPEVFLNTPYNETMPTEMANALAFVNLSTMFTTADDEEQKPIVQEIKQEAEMVLSDEGDAGDPLVGGVSGLEIVSAVSGMGTAGETKIRIKNLSNLLKSPTEDEAMAKRAKKTKEMLKCDECDKSFPGVYLLKRHKYTHSQFKPFICGICLKGFARKDHWSKHTKTHLK